MLPNLSKGEKCVLLEGDGKHISGLEYLGAVSDGPDSKSPVGCVVANPMDKKETYFVPLGVAHEKITRVS